MTYSDEGEGEVSEALKAQMKEPPRSAEDQLARVSRHKFGDYEVRLRVPVWRDTREWLEKYEANLRRQQAMLSQQDTRGLDEKMFGILNTSRIVAEMVYAWPGMAAHMKKIDEHGTAADFFSVLQELILIANPSLALGAAVSSMNNGTPAAGAEMVAIAGDIAS